MFKKFWDNDKGNEASPRFKQLLRQGDITASEYHTLLGEAHNIPDCCIKLFNEHNDKGILSALHQRNKHGDTLINKMVDKYGTYVHCDKCIEKFKKELQDEIRLQHN